MENGTVLENGKWDGSNFQFFKYIIGLFQNKIGN